MIEHFRNNFFVARCDSPRAVVEVVRSSMAFRSAHDAALAFTPLLSCLDGLGRSRFSLLLDARDSVANNNPDYESWYTRYRAEMMRDFRRVAILVRTPVGSLQATRLLPPVACPARVFLDVDQAWAFVTEPASIRPSRRPLSLDADIFVGESTRKPNPQPLVASERPLSSGVSPKPSPFSSPQSSSQPSTGSNPRSPGDSEQSQVSPTTLSRLTRRLPSTG